MKKYLLYISAALVAMSFSSCKEDDINMDKIDVVNQLDRMPRTMFRTLDNTGKDETETYGCHVIHDDLNSVYLSWFGIEGCAGYEVRYALQANVSSGLAEDWDAYYIEDIVINDPNQLELTIKDLEYSTRYYFAIRVLSPKGERHHSPWYGYGGQREWAEYFSLTTDERYPTPTVLTCDNKGYNSFDVHINLKYSDSGDNASNNFTDHFTVGADGNYVAHTLVVKPSPTNPKAECPEKWQKYSLNNVKFVDGKATVTVDGLSPNSVYVVYLVNEDIPVAVDAMYNQIAYRTYGDPGAPITIAHSLAAPDRSNMRYYDSTGSFLQETYDNDVIAHNAALEFDACRLDTVISRYNADIRLAEGQTFYLEGDKAYYINSNTELCKGFTLATLPEDLAKGKRAKVYLGGIRKEGTEVKTFTFMFGRRKQSGEADAPISVDNVIFKSIDFDCPMATNYGSGTASGNYLVNMYSNGMAVTFESFQLLDCTFQHIIRGFIRVQGSKPKVFKHMIIDGCVMYNCGYYNNNGTDYAWVHGDGKHAQSNIFQDFVMRNTTIYDSPRRSMFYDGGADLAWPDDVRYNITLENNTIINFSTRSTGRYLFDFKYIPGGSKITLKKNLFVMAADASDKRDLNFGGMNIQNINGSGLIAFDIKDNYSVGCRDEHMKDDGIFTAHTFSSKSAAAGGFLDLGDFYPGWGVLTSADDLKVHVGSTPLKATDLFVAPNPVHTAHNPGSPHVNDHAAPSDIWNALRYRMTSGHEIITKQVGDQRWTSADPKSFATGK